MLTNYQINKMRKKQGREFVPVDFAAEAEAQGMKDIPDIDDRKKKPIFRRNSCFGKKKTNSGKKVSSRSYTENKHMYVEMSQVDDPDFQIPDVGKCFGL